MKIILVSFLYEPEIGGGAALVVNQLAHLLVKSHHSVVVITTWSGDHVKTDISDGIKIVRIPPYNIYWVGNKEVQPTYKKIIFQMIDTWNPFNYHLLRKLVFDEKPDIVHVHKLRGISPSVWSAARSAGVKKVIHTCHDYELLSPEGYFMGKVGKLALEQNLLMRPYQSFRKVLSKSVHFVSAPSNYVMNIHKRMGFFSSAHTGIIINTHGCDLQELEGRIFLSPKQELNKSVCNFLYLGRLERVKGLEILCESFIRATKLNPSIALKIAGWGGMEKYLRESFSKQKNINFIGKVFGQQKEDLINESDILIAPSISQEPFGIVIAEAYAHGLPVITSRAGAFPEIVKDGVTGLMAATGSVSELTAAIVKLSEDPALVNRMSHNCREEARKYSTENFINSYLDIYQGTL